jgi:hypothetical protein
VLIRCATSIFSGSALRVLAIVSAYQSRDARIVTHNGLSEQYWL